ncbi:uncharacterized protein ACLA_016970 [Aspergillus clavatus NRRL 1]|uniref:Uncharacterized protein n=1 Tax=Aspergillus clavatus (strain ATCC 1007 / CBS 513.65 / DSM 816 / NCTC 3887 / NRRL 1 / QM 1276 / 107) TaxID=344612 RepID=A1CBY3_ASPCL|nr:uncharacterized protein ACLA_016970 [Aspergillus clavatus NRRL 1]EAW13251.1 hypothetical protein ACLA_016970 [Aspergillus clavatus NRRL 1]
MRSPILLGLVSLTCAATTLIPSPCFDSYSSLEEYFAYLYPWGSDHNGSAQMGGNASEHEYISIDSWDAGAGREASSRPASYQRRAGDQLSPRRGTLGHHLHRRGRLNGAETWPPAIDMAEWKGTGDISFNTFNTSSEVQALEIAYSSPDEFHSIRTEILTTQFAGDYIGKPLHLYVFLHGIIGR